MSRLRVHVLYEHDPALRPFAGAHIRLLRPLTHPRVRERLAVTAGPDFGGRQADVVIVDRLWRPDVNMAAVESLCDEVRRAGARLIYSFDDNLPRLMAEPKDTDFNQDHLRVFEFLAAQADGILVSTERLKEEMRDRNPRIAVLPCALDERLLCGPRVLDTQPWAGPRTKVIGYMGSHTHDDDLALIAPALRRVLSRHGGECRLELLGVLGRAESISLLDGLPVHIAPLRVEEMDYPLFMPTFCTRFHWDLAIAPLSDTPFNRCKSDIKLLDYAALGAAGIYAHAPAYTTVRHLDTGWLAEDGRDAWEDALERLLGDATLRRRIARGAMHYLYRERTLEHCAHQWAEALERLAA